jgi:hypothetical protein
LPILDCIIALFVHVDDKMKDVKSHSQEILCPSELVTLGLLYALKGVNQSAFYRWLFHNYRHLFPRLPDRTRLFRRLAARQDWTEHFLADEGLLGIADSFGVELLHPRRQGRAKTSEAKKGLSNHRWIVGIKVCALINHLGRVVDWQWQGANTHDKHFRPLIGQHAQTAVLTDSGFHGKKGDPGNLNVCKKGQCNARFLIETVFSLWTGFMGLKKITERETWHLQSHLALAIAAFNCVQEVFANQPDENGRMPLTMAGICL